MSKLNLEESAALVDMVASRVVKLMWKATPQEYYRSESSMKVTISMPASVADALKELTELTARYFGTEITDDLLTLAFTDLVLKGLTYSAEHVDEMKERDIETAIKVAGILSGIKNNAESDKKGDFPQ